MQKAQTKAQTTEKETAQPAQKPAEKQPNLQDKVSAIVQAYAKANGLQYANANSYFKLVGNNNKNILELYLNKRSVKIHFAQAVLNKLPAAVKNQCTIVPASFKWRLNTVLYINDGNLEHLPIVLATNTAYTQALNNIKQPEQATKEAAKA